MGSHSVGLAIKGFEAVEALLKFDPLTAKRVIREVLKKALAPVLAEALRQVPVGTGQLKSSIVIAVPTTKRKTLIRVEIQAGKIPGQKDGWEAYWGLFVEYGTVNADGSQAIAPNPFMRRAYELQNSTALAIAEREILDAIVNRMIKKAA